MPSGNPFAVAYIRVSTTEQELGPQAQEHAIRAWCLANNLPIRSVHHDEMSGAVEVTDRPGLCAAIAALGPGGVLVVLKRDRLGRDVFITAMIERLAAKVGASIASVDGVANGDGPEAALLRNIIDSFAAYERAMIRFRTKAALDVKRRKGERTGSIRIGHNLGADGKTLVPDPAMRQAAALAHALTAQGQSQRAVGSALERAGYFPPSGKPWHNMQVQRLMAAFPRMPTVSP